MKFARHFFNTFTVTVADPAVFSTTAHELYVGDTIMLETTGALPTGLAVDTTYYVVRDGITADTFQVSIYRGGDQVVTTGTQSGTQSWVKTNSANLRPKYENDR